MAEIDLDALRAARREASGEEHFVKFGGDRFVLPFELPVDVAGELSAGNFTAALRIVLGDQYDTFWGHLPSNEDVLEFIGHMLRMYGLRGGLPESGASGVSSRPTGKRSRRTSPASTRSTSASSAGGTAVGSVA